MTNQFSIKRLGAALIALVLTAGVSMAHGGHKHAKHGKKRPAAHKHKHTKGMNMKGMNMNNSNHQ